MIAANVMGTLGRELASMRLSYAAFSIDWQKRNAKRDCPTDLLRMMNKNLKLTWSNLTEL